MNAITNSMTRIVDFLAGHKDGEKTGLCFFGERASAGLRWQLKNARKLKEDAMRERLAHEFADLEDARGRGL